MGAAAADQARQRRLLVPEAARSSYICLNEFNIGERAKLFAQARRKGDRYPHIGANGEVRDDIPNVGETAACAGSESIDEQMNHRWLWNVE
jgi:hypothetical protein